MDTDQISHVARLAVLAMVARGVAAAEFATSPEVAGVHISVGRPQGDEESPVDLEFMSQGGHIVGGLSL